MGFPKVGTQTVNKGDSMHPMIDKSFTIKIDGELRKYTVVKVEEGWIKLNREGIKGHTYLHEDIHKHFLAKLGYQRSAT